MATVEKPAVINVDPEVQAAIGRALEGVRAHDSMREAAERMDGMREEMRARVGTVNLAVPLIRETRDSAWFAATFFDRGASRPAIPRVLPAPDFISITTTSVV